MPRALLIVAALVLGTSVASARKSLVVLTGSTSGVLPPWERAVRHRYEIDPENARDGPGHTRVR